MNQRDTALRYGDALLYLLRREIAGVHRPRDLMDAYGQALRWQRINALCDRFERLAAHLARSANPLLWDGDYA